MAEEVEVDEELELAAKAPEQVANSVRAAKPNRSSEDKLTDARTVISRPRLPQQRKDLQVKLTQKKMFRLLFQMTARLLLLFLQHKIKTTEATALRMQRQRTCQRQRSAAYASWTPKW